MTKGICYQGFIVLIKIKKVIIVKAGLDRENVIKVREQV